VSSRVQCSSLMSLVRHYLTRGFFRALNVWMHPTADCLDCQLVTLRCRLRTLVMCWSWLMVCCSRSSVSSMCATIRSVTRHPARYGVAYFVMVADSCWRQLSEGPTSTLLAMLKGRLVAEQGEVSWICFVLQFHLRLSSGENQAHRTNQAAQ
jgi:hypothetical protein